MFFYIFACSPKEHKLATPEGLEAKKYVSKKIKTGAQLGIKTYGCDRYGRYLADVMYGNEKEIFKEGAFLNQDILDDGFGVTKSELTWG